MGPENINAQLQLLSNSRGMGIKLNNVFKKGLLPVDLSMTLKRAAGHLEYLYTYSFEGVKTQGHLYTYSFQGIKTQGKFLATWYFKIQHYKCTTTNTFYLTQIVQSLKDKNKQIIVVVTFI